MDIRDIITVLIMSAGFVCFFVSAVGVFRLRDFYSRLHAASVCESAGLVLCSLGLFIYQGFNTTGFKIFAIFLAVFVASPIGTHIIAKVAYKQSLEEEEVDEDACTDS